MGTNVAIIGATSDHLVTSGAFCILLIFCPLYASCCYRRRLASFTCNTIREDPPGKTIRTGNLNGCRLLNRAALTMYCPSVLQWLERQHRYSQQHSSSLTAEFLSTLTRSTSRFNAILRRSIAMQVRESFSNARRHLWDEELEELLSFFRARAVS